MGLPKEVVTQIEQAVKSDAPLDAEIEYKDSEGNSFTLTLSEALESPMLKKQFIKETTKIAEERKQLQDTFDKKLDTFLENIAGAGEKNGDEEEEEEEPAGGTGEESKVIAKLSKRLKGMEAKFEMMEKSGKVAQEEREIMTEMETLKKEFPFMRQQEVLIAYANQAGSLKELAEASHSEIQALIKSGGKGEGEKAGEKEHPPKPKGAGPGGAGEKPPETLAEADERAKEYLNNLKE